MSANVSVIHAFLNFKLNAGRSDVVQVLVAYQYVIVFKL